MKKAIAISVCAILIIIFTIVLLHITDVCLKAIENPLSLSTVKITLTYTFAFILITFFLLLMIAFILGLASD
jgi:ABC-type sulfate transport system permease component